ATTSPTSRPSPSQVDPLVRSTLDQLRTQRYPLPAGGKLRYMSNQERHRSAPGKGNRREVDMDLGLHEHTALITGADSGIGLACAQTLLAEGASVVIADQYPDQLRSEERRVGKECRARGAAETCQASTQQRR